MADHAHGPRAEDEDWMPVVRTPTNDPSLRIPETLTKPGHTPDLSRTAAGGDPGGRKDGGAGLMEMGKAWGVAFDFIFTIAAGAGLGWGFDAWRGTAPTGSLVGFAGGFAMALVRIIRHTLKQERLEQEAKAKARAERQGDTRP